MTLATSHCEADRRVCNSNAECSSGWVCEPDPSRAVGTGCAVARLPDGGTADAGCPVAPPPPVVLICVPPWSNLGYGGHALNARSASEGGTVGVPKNGTGTPMLGSGAGTGPFVPVESTGKDVEGNCSCHIGSRGPGSQGAALLGALGLIALIRRRR